MLGSLLEKARRKSNLFFLILLNYSVSLWYVHVACIIIGAGERERVTETEKWKMKKKVADLLLGIFTYCCCTKVSIGNVTYS